jgi:hypothetical protein
MTLASSGTISIGGTTATRSINLELGRAATATSNMGETDLRTLAGVSSGAISMSQFWGKTAAEIQAMVVGTYYDGAAYIPSTSWGFGLTFGGGFGTLSDGTLGVSGNATIGLLNWNSIISAVQLSLNALVANSGWTTMTVNGVAFTRASGTYSQNTTSNTTTWQFGSFTEANNPFGTTVGATRQVVFV